ncbi:hypothetical protein FQR65_LT16352 [Abscondita terminalis]|nr:hypothetical protein FQR65_LT16352 [Abscondita terminalis]
MEDDEILIIDQIINDVAEAEEDAEQPIRRRFEHIDPFEALSNTQFISLFRMNKDLARVIINMLQPYIVQTHGATAIDLQTKLLYLFIKLLYLLIVTFWELIFKSMDEEEVLLINQIFDDLQQAEEDGQAPARQRYQRTDPFVTLADAQFIQLFRVDKDLARQIIISLTPYMDQGQTYSSLDIETKVWEYFPI